MKEIRETARVHLNLFQANKMTKQAFMCNPQASALMLFERTGIH